jgi:hypothetical protein
MCFIFKRKGILLVYDSFSTGTMMKIHRSSLPDGQELGDALTRKSIDDLG